MNWLQQNMQKWTPFSAIVVIAVLITAFIAVWDTVSNITVPVYIVTILSFLVGGTGASQLITHGSNITNGTLDRVNQISQSLKENNKP